MLTKTKKISNGNNFKIETLNSINWAINNVIIADFDVNGARPMSKITQIPIPQCRK